jgi:hypothetical protein
LNGDPSRVRRAGGDRAGFSLSEVLASMLAASVLALSSGSLLFFGFRGWSEDLAAVGAQRDAGFALDLMDRALRTASATNVAVTSTQISVLQDGVVKSFSAVGDTLVYDPDTGAGGDEMVVISRGLQSMEPSHQTNAIEVVLRFGGALPPAVFSSRITFRN